MKPFAVRTITLALVMTCGLSIPVWAKPACPVDPTNKSHTIFLYFPTADDPTFPNYDPAAPITPAKAFDAADLDPNIGSTNQLMSRIFDVVTDDYCEFNVQVQQTTTNPESLPSPPARRTTVAIGSDVDTVFGAWGEAQEVDFGDHVNVDFARVWGGTYTTCEGGTGGLGCSMTGSLTGANSTLDRWAEAIGGTAAHEAGHTYGLSHTDDNPTNSACATGSGPRPGEDTFEHHLMPSGCNLDGEARAGYRRHISDRTFGLLATNVGLAVETVHNWDLKNPNAQDAVKLTMEFLSLLPSVTVDAPYNGSMSPWINPKVSGPSGTKVWQGKTYQRYTLTWEQKNPSWGGGAPGVLPGGSDFHIGTTLTGVDFNQPDPIIIQKITLFDANSKALALSPRLPMYDSGTLDPATNDFVLHFYAEAIDPNPLILEESVLFQLPRVASIESMIGDGKPMTFDGVEITPWSASRCVSAKDEREAARCTLGNLSDRPHVQVSHLLGEKGVVDCSNGVPRSVRRDSINNPDYEGPVCAGSSRDPFPSTTLYVIATFVDPKAEHYDPEKKAMVVGPVTSRVFYQFAGVRDTRKLVDGAAPKR